MKQSGLCSALESAPEAPYQLAGDQHSDPASPVHPQHPQHYCRQLGMDTKY